MKLNGETYPASKAGISKMIKKYLGGSDERFDLKSDNTQYKGSTLSAFIKALESIKIRSGLSSIEEIGPGYYRFTYRKKFTISDIFNNIYRWNSHSKKRGDYMKFIDIDLGH